MKRIERKRLKENELAERLAMATEFLERHKRTITGAAVGVVVLLLAVIGVSIVSQRGNAESQQLLGEALVALNAPVVPAGVEGAEGVPAAAQLGATGTFATEEAKLNAALPRLKVAAETHPDSPAGIQARYHLAGALAALGRNDEAIAMFDDVANRAGTGSLYGQMSRLGKADAQARAGQLDAAIETWKGMAAENAAELPVDAILMELARAYVQQGNTEEARRALTQVVDEHPNSPYSAEARSELDDL
jgi:tetratricopeptide (TPR) repeat protein